MIYEATKIHCLAVHGENIVELRIDTNVQPIDITLHLKVAQAMIDALTKSLARLERGPERELVS